jgi:hypothetical protein
MELTDWSFFPPTKPRTKDQIFALSLQKIVRAESSQPVLSLFLTWTRTTKHNFHEFSPKYHDATRTTNERQKHS